MASVNAIHENRAYQLIDKGSSSWTVSNGVLNSAIPGDKSETIQAELIEIKEKQGFMSYTLGYALLTEAEIPDSLWLGGHEVKPLKESLAKPEPIEIDDPREIYKAVPGAELGAVAASAYAFLPPTEVLGLTIGLGNPLLALGAYLALPLIYAGYQAARSAWQYVGSYRQRKQELKTKAESILTGFFADS